MSYIGNQVAFSRESGIQELSLEEIGEVDGGLSRLTLGLIFVGIGVAAVAGAPVLGAGAAATFGIALSGRVLAYGGGLLVAASR